MERTPKNIDDIFRERLQDAAPAPPAFVWDNVERELRQRKRRFLFWIFTFGLVGFSALGLYLGQDMLAKDNSAVAKVENTVPSANEVTATPTPKDANEHDFESGPSNATGAEPEIAITPKPLALRTNNTNNRAQQPRGLATTSKTLPTSTIISPIPQTVKTSTPKHTLTSPTTPTNSTPKTNFNPETARPEASFTIAMLEQDIAAPGFEQAIPNASLLKTTAVVKTQVAKSKAKKSVKNCYDFAKQPNAWILEAYVGPSIAQRELVASQDDRPYLNKRLKTEKRSLAYNAGIRASLMLKGNLILRTGLNYDHMTEVFEYIDPAFVRTIVVNVFNPVTGMSTLDTVGVEYGEKYQKTFNRFGMLDIPVMAGIELRKGRSGFNLNAGFTFNLLFSKRGAIIAPQTGEPAWFTPSEKNNLDVFKPRAGMSASASVQWFYHLKPRVRVFVEPYFKKVLSPVTLNDHPVQQRYGIAGLRIGMAKILN